MKKNYQKQIILSIIGFLSLFVANAELSAQCNDVTLILTGYNSTCLSNGSIKVAITGPDATNIRQSDMQFSVSGTQNIPWTHYANDSIPNLPAGTFTIGLRAFCLSLNDWLTFSTSATTTLTSSYFEMDAVVGVPRATLNCKYTGMIPITIMNNTGSPPFTITMTNNPGTYTGTKTFVTSTRGTPYQIQNLPAGDYSFTVNDDCSYTKTINATVGTMAQDFNPLFVYDYLYAPTTPMPNQCDIVSFIIRQNYSNYTNDERHYFYDNAVDYYQLAFLVNNTGTPVYMDFTTDSYLNWQLPSPYSIRWLRDNSATISVYMSIKGTSCSQLLKNVRISAPDNYFSYSDIGCDSLSLSHYPNSSNSGRLICYPYRWRVMRSDNTLFQDWTNPWIYDYSTQFVRVPFGARIEYEDSEGYTWSKTTQSTPLTVYGASAYIHYLPYGINADGSYKSYIYMYIPNSAAFPAGTRFEYVAGSGPRTPIHTDTTIVTAVSSFFPFSPNYTSTVFDSIPPGVYQYKVTIPGCPAQTVNISHSNAIIKTPFSYTTKETCGGLYVFPSGQLGYKFSDGTESTTTTYYQIFSAVPSSIPIDTRIIAAGDSLFLPTTGMYRIGMNYTNTWPYESWVDTVYYTQTPFTLNPALVSAYVCEDASLGFIRVAGMGGSGNYAYELYDVGTLIEQNTTGVFNYGSANMNYTIRLIDTDPACAASYDQVVNMIDLGIAQIAYSSNPTNIFCLADSIYLKCLTLGETTYTWAGPGITSANEHLQNPAIFAEDIGVGTHTFTITVTPEGCGHQMVQSVTVTVEDCSGAHDDYKVIFVNMPDTVDVLTNDKFPASCASSVVPVITVGPLHGSASVVNNKVFYTPALDFKGKDSITYSTTCGSTTTTAKVYFTVIEMPDNITDANCVIIPRPTGAWSIKNRYTSNTVNGGDVFEMSVPLVGDIDHDGKIEIVCAGRSMLTSNFVCDSLKVFDGITGTVKYKFPVERFHGGFGTIAMADVDGDGYAEIFVATDINAVAGNQGYLFCYSYNGALKWKSSVPYTANATSHAYPYLKIVDFNGDGIPEIMANDRIFNAVTGGLLLDCGLIGNMDYGTDGGHNAYFPNPTGVYFGNFSSAVDMDDDGLPELVAGRNIYKITLNSLTNPSLNTCTILRSAIPGSHTELGDGYTSVADLDLDGTPDVIVIRQNPTARQTKYLYAWSGKTGEMLHTNLVSVSDGNVYYGGSIPFIGDLDGDGVPEISFTVASSLQAYRYDNSAKTLTPMSWSPLSTSDISGATTLTLFDFDQDDKMELVYRDMSSLRIIDGTTGGTLDSIPCFSWTMNEYPVIADVTGGGYANIVVLGKPANAPHGNGYLYVFEHNLSVPGAIPWAPTRKVWNQWAYNAVNINEDLTVPRYQMNPATVFPGLDGILGTSDDVRPYNGFLVQQTIIDKDGIPVWLAPDATPVASLSGDSVSGNTVTLTIAVLNQGDAAIGSPVHYSVYRESITPGNLLLNDSAIVQINAGTTETIIVTIPDIMAYPPLVKLIVRINDKGGSFTFELECDDSNNVIEFINPALHLLMTKDATLLPSFVNRGTFANPVSILFSEEIRYEITAVNANYSTGNVIIRDTLPIYLKHVFGSVETVPPGVAVIDTGAITGPFPRDTIRWSFTNVPSMATRTVRFRATPLQGAVASQPMFDNRAWVQVSDTLFIPTNYTWHQGASVSLVTFSAGFGGKIYQAMEQVLDYRTSPQSGIVIVPDNGYRFAGWSHPDYVSLRGETIRAQNDIMLYDTLTVYGNVELHANFELEEFPIIYYLNGGQFPDTSHSPISILQSPFPDFFTIESESITLGAPEKADDVFIGWTGSNGDEPQLTVTIPHGSTGERTYYANYLYSERREIQPDDLLENDKIWAAENEIYIRTAKPGKIVRIYSMEGILLKQQIILHTGETTIKMARGVYTITLNNGFGHKIVIND